MFEVAGECSILLDEVLLDGSSHDVDGDAVSGE